MLIMARLKSALPIALPAFVLLILGILDSCAYFITDFLVEEKVADASLKGVVFINEIYPGSAVEEDWIELYNKHSQAVDLSGFYLSDDATDTVKWSVPDGTIIQAGSYLVILCDGNDSGLSTNFKLSTGEPVVLTTPSGLIAIDEVASIVEVGAGSYGRKPDGTNTWNIYTSPSKGVANP